MTRYRLSFEVETDADPSDLLDALSTHAESFETGYDDEIEIDGDATARVESMNTSPTT